MLGSEFGEDVGERLGDDPHLGGLGLAVTLEMNDGIAQLFDQLVIEVERDAAGPSRRGRDAALMCR